MVAGTGPCGRIGVPLKDRMVQEVRAALAAIPVDFGGGCSLGKAMVLADLVTARGFDASADIGVYRGRSLFPLAIAHRHSGVGRAYGIDPWDASEVLQHDRPDLKEELDAFAAGTDFDEIFRQVEALCVSLGLSASCRLLRMRSDRAIHYFDENDISFGLVHVDGNHDTALVKSDFELYYPRVLDGGFMVFDDISWDSVKPVLKLADSTMARVFARSDDRADYAVYQKGRVGRKARKLAGRMDRLEEMGRRLEDEGALER